MPNNEYGKKGCATESYLNETTQNKNGSDLGEDANVHSESEFNPSKEKLHPGRNNSQVAASSYTEKKVRSPDIEITDQKTASRQNHLHSERFSSIQLPVI